MLPSKPLFVVRKRTSLVSSPRVSALGNSLLKCVFAVIFVAICSNMCISVSVTIYSVFLNYKRCRLPIKKHYENKQKQLCTISCLSTNKSEFFFNVICIWCRIHGKCTQTCTEIPYVHFSVAPGEVRRIVVWWVLASPSFIDKTTALVIVWRGDETGFPLFHLAFWAGVARRYTHAQFCHCVWLNRNL